MSIQARAAISMQHDGWVIFLRKTEGHKVYKLKSYSFEWVESDEFSMQEPIVLDKLTVMESTDQVSLLKGKSEAQQDEISFLRDQIGRVISGLIQHD